ncbi:MAG: thioredoxin fold domain-containing protein [Nitrospirae bacterium]|nr:thioredoxin fold domain-containing protein [Nitrospirota bacterium]
MKKVIEKRKDIAFYIKLYPLVRIHPSAYEKSKTILCEKSLKLLEDAYEGKQLPKPTCEAKEIDENIKLAAELGISGTPTIIMPNGKVFIGLLTAERLTGLIDSNNN